MDQEQLARWACQLNCWEWPDDFPIAKPAGFDEMTMKQKFDNLVFRIVTDGLRANVSEREVSRQWWIMQMRMDGKTSKEEAESKWLEWWNSGKSPEVLHGFFKTTS